jgi:hypothetical protein
VDGRASGDRAAADGHHGAAAAPEVAVVVGLVGAVGAQLRVRRAADDPHRAQLAIGIGARMGNGLLICLLAWLLLDGQGASAAVRNGFVLLVGAL